MTAALYNLDRQAEAADWVVRLQADGVEDSVALAFDAWLQEDAGNPAAYDSALRIWREYGLNAAEVREGLRQRRPARPQQFGRRAALFGVLAGAAAAAAILVVMPALNPAAEAQAYATATGQHRTLNLADGSRVDLNAGTRLTVALGRHERQVVLSEGQAVFDVAADASRPFLITAGDRTVRVVGTQFDVRRRQGRLSVTVTRGTVEVRPSEGADGATFRLHPGQRLEHLEGQTTAQVQVAAPDQALGWRSGRLVYRDQPLSAVVADLNAEFTRPIRVDDPALAATPVSGVFILDSEDAVLRRLALLVSAHTVPSGDGVTLQRR